MKLNVKTRKYIAMFFFAMAFANWIVWLALDYSLEGNRSRSPDPRNGFIYRLNQTFGRVYGSKLDLIKFHLLGSAILIAMLLGALFVPNDVKATPVISRGRLNSISFRSGSDFDNTSRTEKILLYSTVAIFVFIINLFGESITNFVLSNPKLFSLMFPK